MHVHSGTSILWKCQQALLVQMKAHNQALMKQLFTESLSQHCGCMTYAAFLGPFCQQVVLQCSNSQLPS